MKKIILLLAITSCVDFRNELNKKKTSEERPIVDLKSKEIQPVEIKEGKIYGIKIDKNLKSAYREISRKTIDAKFKDYLEFYNRLNDPKKDFVSFVKENYVNDVPTSIEEKMEKAKDIDSIKKILVKINVLELLLNRPHAFKIEKGKIQFYLSQGIKFNLSWTEPLPLSYSLKVSEEVVEVIKDGVYFINDQPFQIIEVENIKTIDLEVSNFKNKSKIFEDQIENNI